MSRFVAATLLLTTIPFCGKPLPGQTASERITTGNNNEQETNTRTSNPQTPQRGTKDSPFIVDINRRPQSKAEAAADKRERDEKEFRDTWTFRLTWIGAVVNILVIVVGGFGVLVAFGTLRAIKTQIELQGATLIPWIVIQNWQVRFTHRGALANTPNTLTVTFEIANETNFPVTMSGFLDLLGRLPGSARYVMPNLYLLPRRPHNAELHLYPADPQVAEYTSGGMRIAVHGQLSSIGAAQLPSPLMRIDGNLVCGEGESTRFEYETLSLVREESAK